MSRTGVFSIRIGACILASACLIETATAKERSQAEASSILISLPKQGELLAPIRQNGLASSLFSNLSSVRVKALKKLGFKDLTVRNEEGFKHRVMLKMNRGKRPLVVLVAGTGLSVEMEAFRSFAMPLLLQMGWNVALIESHTSGEWIHRNRQRKRLILSGYESGWDLYLTLRRLANHRFVKDRVSETHVLGLSLGGNDAAFAAYFDSILDTRVIDGSIMAWSSPVDRWKAIDHFRNCTGLSKVFISDLFRDMYSKGGEVFTHYSEKGHSWALSGVSNREFINELFLTSSRSYFKRYNHHFHGPIKKIHLDLPNKELSSRDLQSLFSMGPYLSQVRQPILWINAHNDPLVSTAKTRRQLLSMKTSPRIGLLATQLGGHLGYQTAYGGRWVTEAITRYIRYWGEQPDEHYLQWRRD